jgi:6-phosphofructokinase 1
MGESAEVAERLERFRERFRLFQEPALAITTERTMLLQKPNLVTDAPRLWGQAPECIPNPCSADVIGTFRDWNKRKCVTTDMEVIEAYYGILNAPPPGFLEAGPRQHLFFDPKQVQVAIVTAGGIAPGLNTVVHGLVCRHELYGTKEIRGVRGGFRGFMDGDFVFLSSEVTAPWIHHGGTGLRTLRDGPADVSATVDALQRLGTDILYVVGGNGSLAAAHEIWRAVQERGLRIAVAGLPKTMDNDLLWVWKSFGFDTAVAEAVRTINVLHEEAESNNRICVIQLFGRDSGFVAANATLASGEVDAVLIPEEGPIDIDSLLKHLEPRIAAKQHGMVVVAEGIDVPLDDLVHAIRQRFDGVRPGRYGVFSNQPRHVIRAVPASPAEQIYCRRLADLAVDNALAGFTDFMISWWLTEYVLVPLGLVVKGIKRVPTGGIFWKEVRNSTGQPDFRRTVTGS